MGEPKEWWQTLSHQIDAALPDHLQICAHYIIDQTEGYLLLEYPSIKLDPQDYNTLFKAIKQFGGEFCKNPTDNPRLNGYSLFP